MELESQLSDQIPSDTLPRLPNPENFIYFPKPAVSDMLSQAGYGDSMRFVDSIYIDPISTKAVGILEITDEMCSDHMGIMPGKDTVEGLNQTLLLMMKSFGNLPITQRGYFLEIILILNLRLYQVTV